MNYESYLTHHSPWGAYASFMLGQYGQGGGFVLGNVDNPGLSVFSGFRRGNGKIQLLPFLGNKNFGLDGSNYDPDQWIKGKGDENAAQIELFHPKDIRHSLEAATETWQSQGFSFTIYSPQPLIKDWDYLDEEGKRFVAAPALIAEITLDNTGSTEDALLFFGSQGLKRPLSDSTSGLLLGAADSNRWGLGAKAAPDVREILEWSIIKSILGDNFRLRRLSFEGALAVKVPAGTVKTLTMALGFWRDGIVTSGYPCSFVYNELFSGLEEVLAFALDNAGAYKKLSIDQDEALRSSGLNSDRQFLIAHARHSYLASTEFLRDGEGRPVFVVNEGEYQMMNTLDLTVDQAFYELDCTPWTVREELELFLRRYSYYDGVQGSRGRPKNCISFCHDMGVADQFTPEGYSSYELADIHGCFSYMSAEQLDNWILTAALYVNKTDDRAWLKNRLPVFYELLKSLAERDADGDGVMDADSLRCGSGSEITTYDSLDTSLGRARKNLYLAVKNWATALALGGLFRVAGNTDAADECEEMAKTASTTICAVFDDKKKRFPALLETGNDMTIIPVAEGLLYPAALGDRDAVSPEGRFGELIRKMKMHFDSVITCGVCLDATSGAWKLSATSENTWLSKIFLNQVVAEQVLGWKSADWAKWDAVHAGWLRSGPCAAFAAVDQINSRTGADLGSRLYPRLVTSHLWLSSLAIF